MGNWRLFPFPFFLQKTLKKIMALSSINILRQDGGLSRPLQSNDGISGLLFYSSNLEANVQVGNFKLTSDLDVKDILGITGETIPGGSIIKYHIDEYFRQSQSSLYVNISTGTTDFSEIISIKDFANGEIRQLGVYNEADFDTSALTAIDALADQCETEYTPLQVIYSAPLVSGESVEDLVDLKPNDAKRVSYIIGEDITVGSEAARLRAAAEGTLIGSLGTVLGSVSKASVHENIGWVSKFNLVGAEFQNPGFIDGSAVSDKSQTLLNTLDGYAYTFLRKFVGSNGTFHSYSYTTTVETSDFQTIENNRTYDKAFRAIYLSLLPQVNSPLYVDDAGKLEASTIAYFETLTGGSLKVMQDAGEISGYLVDIDPNQNVLSTSKIEITAKIQPVGVARTIEVKLGFTLQV